MVARSYCFANRDQSSARAQSLLEKANSGREMTLEEIADLLNMAGVRISRARVWQIETRAMNKLRRRFAKGE